jgi:D-alanyl-D-alanine dipeptidase
VNRSRASLPRLLLFCFCALLVTTPLRAQTATTLGSSLLSGPKPADAPLKWKQLVGIYGKDKRAHITILEREGQLFLRAPFLYGNEDSELPIREPENRLFLIPYGSDSPVKAAVFYNSTGIVTSLVVDTPDPTSPSGGPNTKRAYRFDSNVYFPRADAGADLAHFFHVTPTRPVEALRAAALAAKPPDEAGPFRNPQLVELITLDPAIHLDIRYAQSNNFLSTPLYTQARAFVQRPAADALLRVLRKLQPLGYGLLIHDAYRPWYITKLFWDATPPEDHNFVADPQKGSKHNRGCAVDLTLYDLASGNAIEMPGLYDEMSPRSFPTFPGGTSLQRWHRDLLRRAMESEGFAVDQNEWWHFDYKDWKLYPILNVPFEKLDKLVN